MPNTDLSSFKKHQAHSLVSLRKPLRCGFAIVLCSCLLYGAAQCRAQEVQAQDVAEAARQERARREQADKPKHVYTDEDLRRAKILTPEDEARLAAKRKPEPTAPLPEQPPALLDANGDLGQLPLGDIARYYRVAKLAKQPVFLLPFDELQLAAPIQPVDPRLDFSSSVTPRIVRPHPRTASAPAISSPAPIQRRDPFSRRLVPMKPAAPRVFEVPKIAPTTPAAVTPAPAISHPSFAAKSAVPSIEAAPARPATARILSTPDRAPNAPDAVTSAPAISHPSFSTKSAVPSIAAAPAAPATPSMVKPAPVSPAAVNPTAPMSGVQTIVVQTGDSLWKIAERTLGRGSRWREVLAANPSVASPESLKAGMQLNLPVDVRAPRTERVTVNAGDTLTKIAQAQYGRASYWRCIAQANPDITDVNRIFAGQQLKLPSRCKP